MRFWGLSLFGLIVGCSGGAPEPVYPDLDDEATLEPRKPLVTRIVDIDFSSCELSRNDVGTVGIRCGPHTISESRADERPSEEDTLEEIIDTLQSQSRSELAVTRWIAVLDQVDLRMRSFAPKKRGAEGWAGMVASLPNAQGKFWGVACFADSRDYDRDWCASAVAALARAGGGARLGAREVNPLEFAGEELEAASSCDVKVRRIRCGDNELSWRRVAATAVDTVEKALLQRIRAAATAEALNVQEDQPACLLRGQAARCLRIHVAEPDASKHFTTLVVAAEISQEQFLVVCSTSLAPGPVPPPCAQLIALVDTKVTP